MIENCQNKNNDSQISNFIVWCNPFVPILQFPAPQQSNLQKEINKKMQDFGTQTEKHYFSRLKSNQKEHLSSQNEEESKQLPLPNKEKLYEIFQCKSNKKKDIKQIMAQMYSEKTKTLNNYYKSIGDKIANFKKTKEEVIKFLVRRTWKRQGEGLSEAREKYYSGYKSMNSDYLKAIFKDQEFVEAYQNILQNFDEDFESFNLRRFNRFYEYFLRCYVNNNLNLFKISKECKSKLPYPHFWKIQIQEIAHSLYDTYVENRPAKKSTALKQRAIKRISRHNDQQHKQMKEMNEI